MKAELTKGDVYVVVDTPKKAKKLKKLLDMFGERTYSNSSIQDCLDNNKNVIGFEKEDNAFMSSYVDQFDNFRKKVSIKELRNILAKEHLCIGDYIVATIGKIKYLVEFERVGKNGCIIGKKYLPFSDFGRNVEPYGWGGFDYFYRYATPEEIALLEPKPKDLEVGKWYKKVNKKGEVFIFNHQKNGKSYGWFKGRWVDNGWLTDCFFDYILLDTKEVESALIEEANRRYRVGDIIKCFDKVESEVEGLDFVFNNNNLFLNGEKVDVSDWFNTSAKVFDNGKWAEVIDKFADLKEAHKNGAVIQFRNANTDNKWRDCWQNIPEWLTHCEYRIKPEDPVKVGDWMFNPNTKKITQVKKDNHGKSLLGSGWVKIKDTELVEKLNSL